MAIGQSYDFDASDNNITWSVIVGTGNAIIDTSTGIVTGTSHGTVKVVATHNVTLEYAYCTVFIIPIAEGRYFFQNSQYDNYMQIDDDSTLSADNAIMELWGYDGANHQRWNVYYLYNGYYKILCHASAKALTAPSSANGAVTQKTYDSNLLTQQWSITNVNGEWKLSPASNPTYYLAAGSTAYASDGRKVQMRGTQSDSKDEWILITNKDVSLVALPESYDRTSFFDSVIENMNSIGYSNYYENQDTINLGADENEIVCRMANSKIMVIRTHGSQTSITTIDGSLTKDEINNLQVNIFSYSEMIVFGACRTGEGRDGADNLVNATHNQGCEIVIGFEESVWSSEVNEWCKQFFKYIALGHSIIDACYAADFYIAYVWLQDHPGIDIRTDSWYIAGDEDKYF